MKKIFSLATLLFILFLSNTIFAQSVDSFVDTFDKLAKDKSAIIPSNVEKKSFEFVPIIKTGEEVTFKMGSEKSDADEKPVHDVTLIKPFEMQRTEVTQLQYELIMGTNPSRYFQTKGATYNRPVEYISYGDVQKFITKLNALDLKYEYRLPTEAEWEYAAGQDPTPLGDYAWFSDNSDEKTLDAAVPKLANKFGLYDMLGSVWEWVSDFYGGRYYSSLDKFVDPQGPDKADKGSVRVMRGGGWGSDAVYCRASNRGGDWSDLGSSVVGFRLVRTEKPVRN